MKPTCLVIRKSEYEVRKVELAICRNIISEFHYAKGGSNTAVFRHGLFRYGEPECLGVAWWIPPTKSAALATNPNDWKSVLSLSRLAILPDVPQNAATFLIGRSIRIIRRDQRWCVLVTYADENQNHRGTIYEASNWTFVGFTKPEALWHDEEGRMISRKAGPKTRTRKEMEELGYHMVGRFRKKKFIMRLRSSVISENQRNSGK